jgi:hypothetical protein
MVLREDQFFGEHGHKELIWGTSYYPGEGLGITQLARGGTA